MNLDVNPKQDVNEHYNDAHVINKENSSAFESYADVISKDPNRLFLNIVNAVTTLLFSMRN